MFNITSLMLASTSLIGGGSLLWFLYKRKSMRPEGSATNEVTTTQLRKSLTKGIRRSFGEPKMVFVINKPLFGGKTGIATQQLYQLIASCCIGYYRSRIQNNQSMSGLYKKWSSIGQMKVVVKGKSDQDLIDIPKKADQIGLKSLILYENALLTNGQNDNGRPLVVCLLGPAKKVDTVTGHFKLL